MDLDHVYRSRFSERDAANKDAIWREIGAYLQRFVPREGRVVDVACDRGDFIRNVEAQEKWATDLRAVTTPLPGVRFVQGNGLEVDAIVPNSHFDLAFMSNYLEHLPSPDMVVKQFQVLAKVLRPRGRVMVLQPNIRFVGSRYWDFIDHKVALTERGLEEAASLAGFRTVHLIARFLPYTTKSRLPQHPMLVRAYLAFPPAWRILGKQTLYIGELVA